MSGTGASTAGRYSFGPGSELNHHQPPTNRGTRPVRARPTATITNNQPPTKGVRRRLARRHRNRPIHLRGGIPMTDPALYRPTVFTATAIGGLTSHEGGDYLVQSDRCARFKQQQTKQGR